MHTLSNQERRARVAQEIDATFGKWANGISREIADLKRNQDGTKQEFADLRLHQGNVEGRLDVLESLLRQIIQDLNIDLI